MAVTSQSYTLTATWTNAQHVALWRQMLIDAGLMTEWYDSVSNSSYEHRILRLTNDASKTYGYQYIWFLFQNGAIYLQFATGWNPTTHVPVGTQYLDYYSSSCGTTSTGFNTLCYPTLLTSYVYTRWTSGDTTFINGPCNIVFKKTAGTPPSWLDLNKQALFSVFCLGTTASSTANGWRVIYFYQPYSIKRMIFAGRAYAGAYASSQITSAYQYGGVNNASDVNDPSYTGNAWAGAIRLPSFSSSVNPAFSSNYSPIITGIDLYQLFDCKMSDDFAFTTTLGVTPAYRDLLYVTPGSEVWEVIASCSAASTNSMCLLARVV